METLGCYFPFVDEILSLFAGRCLELCYIFNDIFLNFAVIELCEINGGLENKHCILLFTHEIKKWRHKLALRLYELFMQSKNGIS
jgi:hypothetical protein